MSNRHLARTIALQSLFQWDFLGQPADRLSEMISFNRQEFAPDFDDEGFVEDLIGGVIEHLGEIDATITQFAPDWPLDTMTIVDRNILRLGTYELTMVEAIPAKVAINESIELAKGFGGESSGRFVNGVLGAIYKYRLAQGKIKEVDKEKKEEPEGPKEEMVKEEHNV